MHHHQSLPPPSSNQSILRPVKHHPRLHPSYRPSLFPFHARNTASPAKTPPGVRNILHPTLLRRLQSGSRVAPTFAVSRPGDSKFIQPPLSHSPLPITLPSHPLSIHYPQLSISVLSHPYLSCAPPRPSTRSLNFPLPCFGSLILGGLHTRRDPSIIDCIAVTGLGSFLFPTQITAVLPSPPRLEASQITCHTTPPRRTHQALQTIEDRQGRCPPSPPSSDHGYAQTRNLSLCRSIDPYTAIDPSRLPPDGQE